MPGWAFFLLIAEAIASTNQALLFGRLSSFCRGWFGFGFSSGFGFGSGSRLGITFFVSHALLHVAVFGGSREFLVGSRLFAGRACRWSSATGISHALFLKAVFGSASQFFLGRLGRTISGWVSSMRHAKRKRQTKSQEGEEFFHRFPIGKLTLVESKGRNAAEPQLNPGWIPAHNALKCKLADTP
jgi:hypothetical protein